MERRRTRETTLARLFAPWTAVLMELRPKVKTMKTYEFSIIASGLDPTAEDFESRFFNAGCDDATVSFQKGRIIVDFARDGASLAEAIASAVTAVTRAGAKIDRIEPDPLVNLSEMASRAGMTRAAMSNYYNGKRSEDFPGPIAKVTSASPLWDWSKVARWMFEHKKLGREVAVAAETVRKANEAVLNGHTDIAAELKTRAEEYAAELERAA
jgi:predicted DNA-binding transcriptional regulator AlpA